MSPNIASSSPIVLWPSTEAPRALNLHTSIYLAFDNCFTRKRYHHCSPARHCTTTLICLKYC